MTRANGLAPRHRRGQAGRRYGTATVEFALVLPILMSLVLGIIEVGRIVMISQMVAEASREACRLAVLSGVTSAAVTSEAQLYLTAAGIPTSAVTTTITGQTVSGGSVDQTINLATIPEGYAVKVKVQVDYAKAAWITPQTFSVPTISASTVMRKEAH